MCMCTPTSAFVRQRILAPRSWAECDGIRECFFLLEEVQFRGRQRAGSHARTRADRQASGPCRTLLCRPRKGSFAGGPPPARRTPPLRSFTSGSPTAEQRKKAGLSANAADCVAPGRPGTRPTPLPFDLSGPQPFRHSLLRSFGGAAFEGRCVEGCLVDYQTVTRLPLPVHSGRRKQRRADGPCDLER